MSGDAQSTKVLITVMTYPHPSKRYQETVCTAGITEESEWLRLYPVYYRYQPPKQQYRKYQRIEVRLQPRSYRNDQRKESRKPDIDSIRILGDPLPTAQNWAERRRIVDGLPHHTLLELRRLYERDRTSLGIVRTARGRMRP